MPLRLNVLATIAMFSLGSATAVAGSEVDCLGDCNGDGRVVVSELVRLVNVSLGNVELSSCPIAEQPLVPRIEHLVTAVGNLLDGCARPMPTPTVTFDDGVLTAGRILRIEFTTSPPFIESLPNTLYAFLGSGSRVAPYGSMTGVLYDGDALLGISTSSTGCCATGSYSFNPAPTTWTTAGSPWDFPAGDPAVVDFDSMHDGTIDGRIDIAIDTGRIEIDLESVALVFIHATFANGGSTIPPAPIVHSVRIVGGSPVETTPTVTATITPVPTTTAASTASPSPIGSPDDDD